MRPVPTENSKFYEPYTYFARTLRGWLVAYGIGAPVVVASQKELTAQLVKTGWLEAVVLVFLSGVLVQILTAFLYKYALWILHLEEIKYKSKEGLVYRLSHGFYLRIWPTAVFDLITVGLYIGPTYIVLSSAASVKLC